MAACIAQQTSTQLPPINFPRKFHRSSTYDSRQTSASVRKRLLSEQGDCCFYSMKYPAEDDDGIKKRTRTGNCVILLPR